MDKAEDFGPHKLDYLQEFNICAPLARTVRWKAQDLNVARDSLAMRLPATAQKGRA